jgi:hypothetical protein
MARTSLSRSVPSIALCLLLAIGVSWAKPKADALAPTRAKLDELETCLGKSDVLSTLRQGLLWGWQKSNAAPKLETPSPSPPPPEYMESLDRDVKVCAAAASLEETQRRAVLDAVRKDIAVKSEDCMRFGMGRRVPVSVKTVRGGQTENGWQVFYRWSCASPLQPEEMRVPKLTSPADVELPPGVYTFRAERRNAAGKVETVDPVTITVGSSPTVPIELPVV